MRVPRLIGVMTAGMLVLAACGGGEQGGGTGEAGGQTRSIQLGFAVKNDMGNAPLVLAKEQGIYADYGLDVELVYFDGGGALVQAMAGGQVGYGWVSHVPVIKAAEQGASLKIIGEVSKTAIGWGLVVAPDSPIKSVEDIEPGMSISYTSEGALTNWYGLYAATQAGVQPSEIKGVPIGTSLPTITTALQKGQIDAAVVLLPWGHQMVAEGNARWVSHMDEQLPKFSFTGIPATEDAVANEQASRCLVGAYTAAVQWMKDNPDEGKKWFQDFYSADAAIVEQVYDKLVADFNETGQMDPERMQFVIDTVTTVPGFLQGDVTAEDVLHQYGETPPTQQECGGG